MTAMPTIEANDITYSYEQELIMVGIVEGSVHYLRMMMMMMMKAQCII